jgi:SET domain-containing protein
MNKIVVKNISKNHRGVFATASIKKGEVIEICPVIPMPVGQTKYVEKTFLTNYYFVWGPKNQPAIILGFGSMYNHSYSPNAEYIERVKDKQAVFKALRDIRKGEEVTHNYNGEADNQKKLWFKVKKKF